MANELTIGGVDATPEIMVLVREAVREAGGVPSNEFVGAAAAQVDALEEGAAGIPKAIIDAQAAADIAVAANAGRVFKTAAEGDAATTGTQSFLVEGAAGSGVYATLHYHNGSGGLASTRRVADKEVVDAAKKLATAAVAGERDYTGASTITPLLVSKGPDGRRVALGWDKTLGAIVSYVRFKGSEFLSSVAEAPVVQASARGLREFTGPGDVPLISAARRHVLSLGRTRQNPLWMGGAWPSRIPGSNLTQWRAQATKAKLGTGKAKVMVFGDSYADIADIPQQLANLLRVDLGNAGAGWIPVQGTPLDTATFSASAGWTVFDVATGGGFVTQPASGLGHDGKSIYTAATDQTATWNFTGTEFRLFYGNNAVGAFRYRVDGGAWATATSNTSGALGVVTVAGLAAGSHTVEVDTSVNTGTAAIYGLYFTSAAGVGVEVLKCGNGSLHAGHLATYVSQYVAGPIANMAPDVIIVILATNDYASNNSSPAIMVSAFTTLVASIRAILPEVSFLFVTPPDTSLTPVSGTLPQYSDAVNTFCRTNGHEHYSAYDDWASWAVENARGMWGDIRHVNAAGAYRLASRIKNTFLSL